MSESSQSDRNRQISSATRFDAGVPTASSSAARGGLRGAQHLGWAAPRIRLVRVGRDRLGPQLKIRQGRRVHRPTWPGETARTSASSSTSELTRVWPASSRTSCYRGLEPRRWQRPASAAAHLGALDRCRLRSAGGTSTTAACSPYLPAFGAQMRTDSEVRSTAASKCILMDRAFRRVPAKVVWQDGRATSASSSDRPGTIYPARPRRGPAGPGHVKRLRAWSPETDADSGYLRSGFLAGSSNTDMQGEFRCRCEAHIG